MPTGTPTDAGPVRPRALMTLADVAWPVDAGKRLRAVSMVRGLAAVCDLDVVILFADADPSERGLPPDVPGRSEVIPARPLPAWRAGVNLLTGRVPWQVAVQDWRSVRQHVAATFPGPYDVAWFGALEHFDQLGSTVSARRVVVDCDDVETAKLQGFLDLQATGSQEPIPLADRVQRRVELPLWARIQRAAVRGADRVLVCSELDRTRLLQAVGGPDPPAERVVTVPNTYPEPEAHGARRPVGDCTLVVVANYGTDQNVDAANWTAHHVLPAVRAAVPGARIRLVGRRPDRVAHLTGVPGLEVVGPVDSVAAELDGAHAVLVPVRFGGGTRLKVLEAFAYGTPVISTSVGCEGIDAGADALLRADDPAAIAAATRRILDEPGLADRLVTTGRELYERSYSPAAVMQTIRSVAGGADAPPNGAG